MCVRSGATKPSDAAPGTIRGDYCIDVGRNVIHGSDSVESAQKELALWFPEGVGWAPSLARQVLAKSHIEASLLCAGLCEFSPTMAPWIFE